MGNYFFVSPTYLGVWVLGVESIPIFINIRWPVMSSFNFFMLTPFTHCHGLYFLIGFFFCKHAPCVLTFWCVSCVTIPSPQNQWNRMHTVIFVINENFSIFNIGNNTNIKGKKINGLYCSMPRNTYPPSNQRTVQSSLPSVYNKFVFIKLTFFMLQNNVKLKLWY